MSYELIALSLPLWVETQVFTWPAKDAYPLLFLPQLAQSPLDSQLESPVLVRSLNGITPILRLATFGQPFS